MIKSKCLCGKKAKYKFRPIGYKIEYVYLACSDNNCRFGIETFATREKEFCTELWNATIKKKIELGNYEQHKSRS